MRKDEDERRLKHELEKRLLPSDAKVAALAAKAGSNPTVIVCALRQQISVLLFLIGTLNQTFIDYNFE